MLACCPPPQIVQPLTRTGVCTLPRYDWMLVRPVLEHLLVSQLRAFDESSGVEVRSLCRAPPPPAAAYMHAAASVQHLRMTPPHTHKPHAYIRSAQRVPCCRTARR